MSQLYILYGFPYVFYIFQNVLEKGLAPFFFKDIEGVFDIGELLYNRIK